MSLLTRGSDEFRIPEILERRTLPEAYKGTRLLTDEEVVISSLIDQQQHVQRLVDFMVVLTRIEKYDDRILCLQLIKVNLTAEQKNDFIHLGGYRLLKRWIKMAEDEDHVDELEFALATIEQLPFDEKAVRQAEIGKVIKKLSKYSSPSGRDCTRLSTAAHRVMELWKEQIQKAADAAAAANAVQAAAVEAKMEERKKKAASAKTDEPAVIEAKTMDIEEAAPDQPVIAPSAPIPTVQPPKATSPAVKLLDIVQRSEGVTVVTSGSKSISTNTSLPTTSATGKGPERRERKQFDMEASAKRLLASRQQPPSSGSVAATAPAASQDMDVVEVGDATVSAASLLAVKPLPKGGLKSKSSAKKQANVRWADETGGMLREVYLVEVEKIKSTVANYKSHKDLVKKEKQMEKETYFSGRVDEVITKTTDWVTPRRLLLSIEIMDNIGIASESRERELQAQRQGKLLEAVYLDDSLIPDDPDDVLDTLLDDTSTTNTSALGNEAPIELSWYTEDETPHTMETENVLPTSFTYGDPAVPAYVTTPMISGSMAFTTMPGFNNASNNFGGGGAFNAMAGGGMYGAYGAPSTNMHPGMAHAGPGILDQQRNNTLLNSLPLSVQSLDTQSLQMIMRDPTILQSLLRADQSVDPYFLRILQSAGSPSDYHHKVQLSGMSTSQGFGASLGMQGSLSGRMNSQSMSSSSGLQMMTMSMHQAPGANHLASSSISSQTYISNPSGVGVSAAGFHASSSGGGALPVAPGLVARPMSAKAQKPCRFYGTPRGCANGDKCPFGHFQSGNLSAGGLTESPGRMGMGMGMGGRGNRRMQRK